MYAKLHIVNSFHLFKHNAFLKRSTHCDKTQTFTTQLEIKLSCVQTTQPWFSGYVMQLKLHFIEVQKR